MDIKLALPQYPPVPSFTVEIRPKQVKEWLDALPLANSQDAGRKLADAITTINSIKLGDEARLKLLELYRGAALVLLPALQQHYAGKPLPLPEKSRQAAMLTRELLSELANGYKLALRDLISRRISFGANKFVPLAVARVIECLGAILNVSYEIYGPTPAGIWAELHQLYGYAVRQNLHELPIAEGEKTGINDLYKQVLLIALADPYRLLQGQLADVREYLARFGQYALLQPLSKTENTHGLLLKQRAGEFLKGHFIVLELYDEHKKQILEQVSAGREEIEQKLKQYVHPFPLENAIYYKKFWIDRQLFLQVLLPLRDKNGELIGYFEGVYQVDAETLREIETDITRTLLLVVAVILITAIMLYPIIISLNRGLIKLSSDLLKGNIELMDVLGSAIAKRDSDTNSHNYRVTLYAVRLAETLGLPSAQIRDLIAGAFLHDVGKIGIRDDILLKPARLSDEEFAVMRGHVLLGVDIISKSNWLAGAREVVEFHHEKFDGSGYMKGLKGKEIPLNARIFTIVDVFDALTSKRTYKEPFGFEEAMNLLRHDSGRRFDPELLLTFSGIAYSLYQETSHAEDSMLEAWLNRLVRKHFLNG